VAAGDVPTTTVTLAAFVEGLGQALTVADFADLAARLGGIEWPIDPPQLAAAPETGLGVQLPRPGPDTSVEDERGSLEAAQRLLNELAGLTRSNDCVIAVEYDGEVIGWIEHGSLDEGLAVGLIGQWRRSLDG
jgi:hypothetical protein